MDILINPTSREFRRYIKSSTVGRVKGILDLNGNVYLGDSYYLQHTDIAHVANIPYSDDTIEADFELSLVENNKIQLHGSIHLINEDLLPFVDPRTVVWPEEREY